MMREAAEVLAPVKDQVIVIGALAVQIALDASGASVTPTRDVDAGLRTEDVANVVTALEAAGLRPSEEDHELGFTWLRGDLKVQLLRPFHPMPHGAARSLPVSNLIPELEGHRVPVAFVEEPQTARLFSAGAAALVALKGEAFGRRRHDGEPVDRDFADAALLIERLPEEILAALQTPTPMRARVLRAATRLRDEPASSGAGARELARSGAYETPRAAELAIRRAASSLLEQLGD